MDVTDVIGTFGRAQKELLALNFYRSFALVFEYYGVMFTMSNPVHWCAPTESMTELNVTEWQNCCLPKEEKGFSQCKRFAISENGTVDNNTIVTCDQHAYEVSSFLSIVHEWDLVCDRQWFISYAYSTFFFGSFVMYPICGYLSDRLGRKPTVLIGSFGLVIVNFLTSFSPSIEVFLLARCLSAASYSFIMLSPLTIFLEFCGPAQRFLLPLITGGVWSIFSTAAMYIGKALKSWKNYYLFASLAIYLPYAIINYLFLPESIHWLITNKKLFQAEDVLLKAAKKNGIEVLDKSSVIEQVSRKTLADLEKQGSAGGWRMFLKDKRVAATMVILQISQFSILFTYTGFLVSLQQLGKDFEMNFIILNIFQFFGSVVNCFVLSSLENRRRFLIFTSFTTGLCFLLIIAVPPSIAWLRIVLSMLGLISINFLFNNAFIFLNEVLPTGLRAFGSTLGLWWGRIGALISPYVIMLGKLHGEYIPFVIFGVLEIVTAAGLFLIPNTDIQNLPDTICESKRVMKLTETEEEKDEQTSTLV